MSVNNKRYFQGINETTGTGAPVHSAVAGDRYTDVVTGDTYQYTTSWQSVSYGVVSYTRRHQTTTNYDYLGYAIDGTAESSSGWTLTRLTLDSSGVSSVMHANDSWDNRVTATYS